MNKEEIKDFPFCKNCQTQIDVIKSYSGDFYCQECIAINRVPMKCEQCGQIGPMFLQDGVLYC
jgi:predicted RNA-binding Zn-ribbon protein involved in translation (DUF1610 family)